MVFFPGTTEINHKTTGKELKVIKYNIPNRNLMETMTLSQRKQGESHKAPVNLCQNGLRKACDLSALED